LVLITIAMFGKECDWNLPYYIIFPVNLLPPEFHI
jgi:hypothetical protein